MGEQPNPGMDEIARQREQHAADLEAQARARRDELLASLPDDHQRDVKRRLGLVDDGENEEDQAAA